MPLSSDVAARLDDATRSKRLLEHPFYKAWAAGTLTEEDLAFYAGQYWRQVEAFPSYLENIAGSLPEGPAKETIRANLSDEIVGDHAALWLDFAASVGAAEDTVHSSPPEPETAACVAGFNEGTRQRSAVFALGMLYGYESQTPGVAATKVEGLRTHYGIQGKGLEYFELHGEMDVEHSAELAAAIAGIATDEASLADAEAGARAGASEIYRLLDGVARERGISSN
jgi:pyrroloquinoline-quinone synthase